MPSPSPMLVLPRPGTESVPRDPIPAPSEAAFVDAFGALLPPASFLNTARGRAAYYVFAPSGPAPPQPSTAPSTIPSKVILIHGVQTPAIGLLPLVTALRSLFPGTTFALFDLWGHGLSETPILPLVGEEEVFRDLVGDVIAALGWGEEEVGVVGYSFGSIVAMGYVNKVCSGEGKKEKGGLHSLVLVAPAGLLRRSWFSEEQQRLLGRDCSPQDEDRARDWVIHTLEGGPLTVPSDAQERIQRGEVVAEAVKQWQLDNHPGHAASVVGIFRDGGVFENEDLFVRTRETGVKALVVLGEKDGMSEEKEIRGFGFDTKVVEGAGHGVVRERAGEVAAHIASFWRGE